ncbi:MAG: hypothetical protein Q8P68_06295 [Candidatus Peregrinibacteria bacterium]|nr:hypothetical protein [Candidatus Peregrinibacteria bacterium]MDZ4245150.1 hypothetical protein [Candidatus Gracilibacteria bacterium]
MPKGKSIRAVWQCSETGLTQGVFNVQKEKIKELTKKKYCKLKRCYTVWKAKIAKNSNTKK